MRGAKQEAESLNRFTDALRASNRVASAEIMAQLGDRDTPRINGPTATHLASGRTLPIVADLVETGTAVLGVSALEDLGEVKAACRGKVAVLGNLNGVELCRWTAREVEDTVRAAIRAAGPGGGFVLSDNHGEIPWQVSRDTLSEISEAVHRWGQYPIQ